MRTIVLSIALAAALPAAADLRPLESRCTVGQSSCFAELAKMTATCNPILRKHAETAREETAADWRRCPVSGFRTVHDVDYVILTDPQGGVWAFTNYVDPTAAVVRDFRFVGKKLFVLETSSSRDVARRYCFLDLSAETPECMTPAIAQVEEKVNELLKEGETVVGDDWKLDDAGAKKISVSRPIFKGSARVGAIYATLSVQPPTLRVQRVVRGR